MTLEHSKCEERKIETLHQFSIDGTHYYLPKGFYLVRDLKKMAGISNCHVLAEIRDGKVDDMTDDTATHIEGGEVFKHYPGKGDNS